MTDTIELPRALAERLRAAAAAEGEDFNSYAVARLEQSLDAEGQTDEETSEDRIASLKEGLAQVNAGQLRTFEQLDESVEAALAARRARLAQAA